MEMDGGMDGLGGSRCSSDALLGELLEGIRQRIKPELRLGCEVNAGALLRWTRRPSLAVDVLQQGAFLAADVHKPRENLNRERRGPLFGL